MTGLYRVAKTLAGSLLGIFYPLRINGARRLPEGPVVLVSNHISNWDVLALGRVFDRQICFMAKKELFKNPLLRRIVEGLGAFPVDRGSADVGAIRRSLELLSEGGVVGIFPQGTRVKDDSSFEMADGASMIALRARASIVPVHIVGPYRLFRRVKVNIGQPIPLGEAGGRISRDMISSVSAQVHDSVVALRDA